MKEMIEQKDRIKKRIDVIRSDMFLDTELLPKKLTELNELYERFINITKRIRQLEAEKIFARLRFLDERKIEQLIDTNELLYRGVGRDINILQSSITSILKALHSSFHELNVMYARLLELESKISYFEKIEELKKQK